MSGEITNYVFEAIPHFEGYVYPNEATQQPLWSVLIVLYPYITGLVAGAFIMVVVVDMVVIGLDVGHGKLQDA